MTERVEEIRRQAADLLKDWCQTASGPIVYASGEWERLRDLITTALAQAEREREEAQVQLTTLEGDDMLILAGPKELDQDATIVSLRAEVERLKEQRDAVEDLRQMAAANATGQALRAERAEAALAHVREALSSMIGLALYLDECDSWFGAQMTPPAHEMINQARAALEGRG